MATLVLAAGVPMVVAGDELGRTQGGNNNAYCQDSPTSWVHWDTRHDWADLTELTRRLLALRAEHPVFRRSTFRHGEQLVDSTNAPLGRKNLAWFGGGTRAEMSTEDWHDPHRRTLGVYLAHDAPNRDHDEAFLVWFHGGSDPVEVVLPDGGWADTYTVVAHTGEEGELPGDKVQAGGLLRIPGRTVVVLQVD
jgi:glycogen debranching enzyme